MKKHIQKDIADSICKPVSSHGGEMPGYSVEWSLDGETWEVAPTEKGLGGVPIDYSFCGPLMSLNMLSHAQAMAIAWWTKANLINSQHWSAKVRVVKHKIVFDVKAFHTGVIIDIGVGDNK